VTTIRPSFSLSRFSLFLGGVSVFAQPPAHNEIKQLVEQHKSEFVATSKTIWDYAELGYHEEKSSALLSGELKKAGFQIQSGVADEPTAFVASYGQGKPVIAILGEFDALPGLSQAAVPDRSPIVDSAPGHGCGHNLLGSGAALAAVALKQYMERLTWRALFATTVLPRKKADQARCTCSVLVCFKMWTLFSIGIPEIETASTTGARSLSPRLSSSFTVLQLMRRPLPTVAAPDWMP
jgi:hypothetical protein